MILLILNFENIIFQKKRKWTYVYILKLPFNSYQLVNYERKEVDIAEGLFNILTSLEYEK